ncbi:MAG: choice-of-anchor Q domain-containing protein, partial [Myxococcota bacterium]|nr:choice-of-anchor Q domain-containing protein [Myxococcota bacterium]
MISYLSESTRFSRSLRGALAALLCSILPLGSAGAADLVVDTPADANSSSPPIGACSLRQAILAASGNVAVDGCPAGEPAPAVDTIHVPAGVFSLSIPGMGENAGETGDLDIPSELAIGGDLVIQGAGTGVSVIEAFAAERAFHLLSQSPADPEASVVIRDLSVFDGSDATGGGILNELAGSLELHDVEVFDSQSGIANGGSLVATGLHVHDNQGPGLVNVGIVAFLTLSDSTIESNAGDAIHNTRSAIIDRVTLRANQGAGVRVSAGITPLAVVTNSTLHGNEYGLVGSGNGFLPSNVSLLSSTLTGSGVDAIDLEGAPDGVNFRVGSSIVEGDCAPDVDVDSLGGNIEIFFDSCGFEEASDQVQVAFVDVDLGLLGDNGGPTQTRALGPASVARDAAVDCPATDQRGVARTAPCDAGAFEAGANLPAIVVDSTADENDATPDNGTCTLREALIAANQNMPVDGCSSGFSGTDRIVLPAGTYALTLPGSGAEGGDLVIDGDVEIEGVGALVTRIDAGALSRVLSVTDGTTAVITGVTLEGGRVFGAGGGVHNEGDLTLVGCEVRDNATTSFLGITDLGGGIYNGTIATLRLVDSTVAGNGTTTGGRGGGIYDDLGIVSIENSTVSSNFAGEGGGLGVRGVVTALSATLANNVGGAGFTATTFGTG